MLLILANYLSQYESAFQVFQYLTLRGILAAGTALAISLLVGPAMIRRLNYQIVCTRSTRLAHGVREQCKSVHKQRSRKD